MLFSNEIYLRIELPIVRVPKTFVFIEGNDLSKFEEWKDARIDTSAYLRNVDVSHNVHVAIHDSDSLAVLDFLKKTMKKRNYADVTYGFIHASPDFVIVVADSLGTEQKFFISEKFVWYNGGRYWNRAPELYNVLFQKLVTAIKEYCPDFPVKLKE